MASNKRYVIRFEGNNSKRWDGKEIWLESTVLDELYDVTELVDGAKITVPFKGKGGKMSHWNAVFVDPATAETSAAAATSQPAAATIETRIETAATGSQPAGAATLTKSKTGKYTP